MFGLFVGNVLVVFICFKELLFCWCKVALMCSKLITCICFFLCILKICHCPWNTPTLRCFCGMFWFSCPWAFFIIKSGVFLFVVIMNGQALNYNGVNVIKLYCQKETYQCFTTAAFFRVQKNLGLGFDIVNKSKWNGSGTL